MKKSIILLVIAVLIGLGVNHFIKQAYVNELNKELSDEIGENERIVLDENNSPNIIDKDTDGKLSSVQKDIALDGNINLDNEEIVKKDEATKQVNSNSGKKFTVVDGKVVEVIPIELELDDVEQERLDMGIKNLQDAMADNEEYAYFIENKMDKIITPTLDSNTEQAIANLYQEEVDEDWAKKIEIELNQFLANRPAIDIWPLRVHCRQTFCELYLRYIPQNGKADFMIVAEQARFLVKSISEQDFYKRSLTESNVFQIDMERDGSFAQIYLIYSK